MLELTGVGNFTFRAWYAVLDSGMARDLTIPEKLRENARLVLAAVRDQLHEDIGYNEAGVRWLDAYLQQIHLHGDTDLKAQLVPRLGAFLGECIIQTYGGTWSEDNGRWGVQLSEGNVAFPLSKVAKHLDHGAEDSVLSFFTMIPVVFRHVHLGA